MTDLPSFPPTGRGARRKRMVKTIGMIASALMVVLVVSVFVLILRSESAHDEDKCPFERRNERLVGRALVREEARRCLPEAEEHRWLVSRPGQATFELGRKRLPAARFNEARTQWRIREEADHKLVLEIEVDTEPLSEFREVDLPAQ